MEDNLTQDAIKRRLNQRVGELCWDLRDVERATGYSYRSIQNWLRKDTAVPADFVAQFCEAVPVNPVWLITGVGGSAPVERAARELVFELAGRAHDLARDPMQEPDLVREWLLACIGILGGPSIGQGPRQESSE